MPDLSLTRPRFAHWVREALNRLYDLPYLDAHPLGKVLCAGATTLRGQALRGRLLEAIESLRPAPAVPPHSRDWRGYRILDLRYVSGLPAAEVMRQLALGRSQFFLEQARILDVLTEILWSARPETQPGRDDAQPQVDQEMGRLLSHPTWETVDLGVLVRSLQPVVESRARLQDVTLSVDLPHAVTLCRADRVLLRQTILHFCSQGIEQARGGRLRLESLSEAQSAGLRINLRTSTPPALPAKLETYSRCLDAMQGELQISVSATGWHARLAWRTTSTGLLMVIDDNPDVADLFRRYLAGTNWEVGGFGTTADARQAMAERRPTVIALDVILPKEDGWEFLLALKADAHTSAIPVIICSAIDEPGLAASLGAHACLPKPITQAGLLAALQPFQDQPASLAPAC